MRVLIVLYRDSERVGGSIRVAEVLARYLLGRNVDVKLVFAYGSAGRLGEVFSGRCHYIGATSRKDVKNWYSFRRFLRKEQPCLVHFVDNVGWMMVASLLMGIKKVAHLHYRPDAGVNAGIKRYLLMRFIFGLSDYIIAISNGAKDKLVNSFGVQEEKVSVVHNSIHSGYLINSGDRDGIQGDVVKIGMAVRVVKDKGVEDAVKLLVHLPDRFCLVIAGDGPDREFIAERAMEFGVSSRIEWLGSIENISNFYSVIDFYAYMSWYEGFGLSVAEAMYCEVPVVGLLGDGEISEASYPLVTSSNSLLIPRSKFGVFEVESNDELLKSLAAEIMELESDQARLHRMTKNAKAWVDQKFSEGRFGKDIFSVYEKMLRS